MRRLRNRINIFPTVIIACAFAAVLWLSLGKSFSEAGTDVKGNRAFAQAQHLIGQWVRPDGGYKLVIEDIKPDGSLKVSYYNPRKINVHEANWKIEKDSIHLFIELRDVNYPGSKYSLVYIKEKDVLEGTYFQAVAKETYSVKFLKVPEA